MTSPCLKMISVRPAANPMPIPATLRAAGQIRLNQITGNEPNVITASSTDNSAFRPVRVVRNMAGLGRE